PIIVAGADINDLVVTTSRGGTIAGRIVFDTGTPPSDLRPGSIQLQFANATPDTQGLTAGRSKWNDDWTFETVGLMGSRLVRFSNAPRPTGWFLKAVIVDGKDVTDTPLDFDGQREIKGAQIVLTQKRTEVTGAVVDSKNAAVGEY